jgi:P pilus assembly chaperone PapD
MRPFSTTLALKLTLALGFLAAQAQVAPAPAPQPVQGGAGDLLVAPTRVVFDLRKRSAELNLSNIGSAAATYRISLVRMEMDETGQISEKPLDKSPGAVDLPSLIRFSPREVTLGPQESQTVRLQVRKPAELPAGEYRIHMVFRAIPPAPEAPKEPSKAEPSKGLSIKLVPVYGLAIPVIVRHGETSAKASLSGLDFDPATRALRFHLDRQGNQSVYGDLKATWQPKGGAPETLAEAAGVAVYVPNATRKLALVLAAPKGAASFGPGRLKVTFALPLSEGGTLLAEAFLDLP